MYICTYVPVGVMYMNVCHLCVGGRMLGLGVGECGCSECGCVRTCVLLLTVTVAERNNLCIYICIHIFTLVWCRISCAPS